MKFLILLLVTFLPATTLAASLDPIITKCHITPQVKASFSAPKKIAKGNNLRRKPGFPEVAKGEAVHIQGKVVDSDCVPVEGAIVEIWQADPKGRLPGNGQEANFIGSGTANTNNLGAFDFLTVIPGRHNGKPPHVNIRVRREGLKSVTTQLFFADTLSADQRNNTKKSQLIKAETVADPYGKSYSVLVTLQGENGYRKF